MVLIFPGEFNDNWRSSWGTPKCLRVFIKTISIRSYLVTENVIVDLNGAVKLPDLIDERVNLLNVKTSGGLPQTFYFRFSRSGSEILAMVELNSLEHETLRKQLVRANNELSNLNGELQKKNAELVKLNDIKKQLTEVVKTSEERYRQVVENANCH